MRKDDRVGTMIDRVDETIAELAPVSTQLGSEKDAHAGEVVPVHLRSRVTEVGTLELWCDEAAGDKRRWKLEYNVREQS